MKNVVMKILSFISLLFLFGNTYSQDNHDTYSLLKSSKWQFDTPRWFHTDSISMSPLSDKLDTAGMTRRQKINELYFHGRETNISIDSNDCSVYRRYLDCGVGEDNHHVDFITVEGSVLTVKYHITGWREKEPNIYVSKFNILKSNPEQILLKRIEKIIIQEPSPRPENSGHFGW